MPLNGGVRPAARDSDCHLCGTAQCCRRGSLTPQSTTSIFTSTSGRAKADAVKPGSVNALKDPCPGNTRYSWASYATAMPSIRNHPRW